MKSCFGRLLRRFISTIAVTVAVSAVFAEPSASTEKVRIAYYENEVFQEGARPGAVKTGYAYEYYRKLSEYTGWEYEYVYGSFSDVYNMLLDGKVDLIAGLAYSKSREGELLYQDLPMGSTQYYLLKMNSDKTISTNPKSLNGTKIGVLNSVMVQQLDNWMKENDVDAEKVVYEDLDELLKDFDERRLKTIIIEGSGSYGRQDTDAFICVGQTDFYLCVSKYRPDLLKKLNEARKNLDADSPSFITYLASKYFHKTVSSRTFSDVENAYLSRVNEITVGYLNNYLPYCTTGIDGKPTGLIVDVFPEMLKNLGLTDSLNIRYRSFNNYHAMIEALAKNEISLAFPVGGGMYFSEVNNFYQSRPVLTTSVGLVYNGSYEKNHAPVFAINRNNDMQYYYVISNFPEATIYYCDSIKECLDAVKDGSADFVTINGMRVSTILKNTKYRNLSYRILAQQDERCFGVRSGNQNLLHIINRGIGSIPTQFLLNKSYPYMDKLHKYTVMDYLRNIFYVLVPLIFLCVVVVVHFITKSKNELKEMNKELSKALEKGATYITNMMRYAFSDYDADKTLNQLIEYIGKDSKADRVYIFEETEKGFYDNTYEWCKEGVSAQIENLKHCPYEGFLEVWIKEFENNGRVIIKNVEEYKSVNEGIANILKMQDVNSLVAVPIFENGKIFGFVGLDNPHVESVKAASSVLSLVEFFFSVMIRLRNNMNMLKDNAVHDQMTGCNNRRALSWAYEGKYDVEKSMAVIVVDMNGLKTVNDNQGHEAGDRYICRTAEVLSDVFGHDNIYRTGGDEFAVVLPGKTQEEFTKLLNGYFILAGTTVSIGHVFYPVASVPFADMMREADFNMYKEKNKFYQDKRKKRAR